MRFIIQILKLLISNSRTAAWTRIQIRHYTLMRIMIRMRHLTFMRIQFRLLNFHLVQIRIQLPKMRIHAGPDLNRWFKGMLVHIVKNHIRIVRQLVKTEKK